jgi:diguanylate cyclase (GGDEF)-like protein
MRRWLADSLLLRFSILSAVLLGGLGAGLVVIMRDQIVDHALAAAEDKALTIGRAGIEQHLTDRRLAGMGEADLDTIDRLVSTEGLVDIGVRRLKIYNDESRLVYSDDRDRIGEAGGDHVREALQGHVSSEPTTGVDHTGAGEKMLEVYLPLRRRHGDVAAGVLEVYLPYSPVAAQIRTGTQRLYAATLIGLAILWLGLFRTVAQASGALRRNARELRHQARHDALTGLANRTLLEERLRHALARERRTHGRVAVVLLDLDEFKTVNDSLGHAAGDTLLTVAAHRLQGVIRTSDTIARLGGDEFAVLLEDPGDLDAVTEVAQRLLDALRHPIHLAGRQVYVYASAGIALSDALHEAADDEEEAIELLRGADMAMYAAKAQGKNRTEVFAAHMHAAAMHRLERKAELQRALDRDELRLHFQPIVHLETGDIEGVEALVRWQHPERGLVGPGEFVPLAEETNLILPLGAWVLRQACQQAARWREEFPHHPDRYVSVNVAGSQLQREEFLGEVQQALSEARLPARSLMLEVTESSLLEDSNTNARRLEALRRLGVRLAIDDFGTGYSALSYLRRFRMDVLKIDRSFIDGVDTPSEQSALVDAILTMAQALNLRVVAEGIEHQPQLAHLRERACPLGQGFLLARPLAPADLSALLTRQPDLRALTSAG